MHEPHSGPTGSSILWRLVRVAVQVFYRVERVGPPLPDGALLLVANHPNTLLDPSLVQSTAGRPVRFLAKSTLFHGQFLSPIVRRSGAIPVYRKIDPGVDTSRNVEMFAAVQQALADGHAICLFPEGVSHVSGRLEPLRSGAARMVLTSCAAGHPVTIVSVGLNFDRLPLFRSRVIVVFGQPFDGADLVEAYRERPQDGVRELTDRITDRLRRLMIEADPRADLPLVARIDRLYAAARGVSRDPAERVRRRQLIATGIERLRANDTVQYDAILDDLRAYDDQLKAFGLRESDLDRRMPTRLVVRFLFLEGIRALALAPLALLGVLCFAPPYWTTWTISRKAPDLQSRATWQVVGGVVIYGTWIAALATGAGLWLGTNIGVVMAVVLPILAFVGLAAFEREASALKLVRAFLASRQTPLRARARLKRQRAAIATVLDQVREWLDTEDPAGRRRS
ncbi:MAG: 1-acyl-sn-glycerol-3-phosphate acyltransferase [Vicinamibacterales bacterium]|jgi:1-acyl-sn-glycerol-3-phosphate acyltransferase|nr:1-acyl-sn-glycerol-3-phosphate acyltransferase [Vicinamibacterales bacterium]